MAIGDDQARTGEGNPRNSSDLRPFCLPSATDDPAIRIPCYEFRVSDHVVRRRFMLDVASWRGPTAGQGDSR
jgi:hypothetical protein